MIESYTYAVLKISASAYKEIREKLLAAGYQDQFIVKSVKRTYSEVPLERINMHGLALEEIPDS